MEFLIRIYSYTYRKVCAPENSTIFYDVMGWFIIRFSLKKLCKQGAHLVKILGCSLCHDDPSSILAIKLKLLSSRLLLNSS